MAYFVGPLALALVSIRVSCIEKEPLSKVDWTCIALAIATSIYWYVSGQTQAVFFLGLGIEVLATIPILCSTARDPERESLVSWAMMLVADLLNLTVADWTNSAVLLPVLLVIQSVLVTGIIVWSLGYIRLPVPTAWLSFGSSWDGETANEVA